MKKLMILGLIAWVFLTGCNVRFDFNSDAIRFTGYDEFKEMEKDLDKNFKAVEKSLEVDEDDIKSLNIGTVVADIEVIYESRDTALIHYYGFYEDNAINEDPDFNIKDKGHVKFEVDWDKITGSTDIEAKVYLPKDLKVDIDLSSVSGDIDADELTTEDLNINTVSGEVFVMTVEANEVDIQTVSGDVKIDDMIADTLAVDATSGSVNVAGDIGPCNIGTVSGDSTIEIEEQKGDININTVSGEVLLTCKEYNSRLDLGSVSGDINVVPSISSVKSEDHSVEGEIGSGKYEINIGTVSGDIDLR